MTTGAPQPARALADRGDAIMLQGYSQGAHRFEEAISCYEAALDAEPRDIPDSRRAAIHANLAEAYRLRPTGDPALNLELALDHARRGARLFRDLNDSAREAVALLNLAGVLAERLAGNRETSRDEARGHLLRILQITTQVTDPLTWGRAHLNLGLLYATALDPQRFEANRAKAVDHLRTAIDALPRDGSPRDWALAQHHLGVVLAERDIRDDARAHFQRALEIFTPGHYPTDCARTLCALGDLDRDVESYRRALLIYDGKRFPLDRRDTLRRLGDIHFDDGDWVPAEQCYAKAIELGEQLWQALQTPAGRTGDVAETYRLHARAAFSALRLGEPAVALERLEQGKTRLLPWTRADLAAEAILQLAPEPGALVLPLVTSQGSAVFVIPGEQQHVDEDHVLALPSFTDRDLQQLLGGEAGVGGWINGYFRWQHDDVLEDWQQTIDDTCVRLWDLLMGPVHERLETLDLQPGSPVVIMPQGGLALLPLHAAWRRQDGERRFFLDDYTVAYAPGASVLRECVQRRASRGDADASLLAVSNPSGDLPFARSECGGVRGVFAAGRQTVLEGGDATVDAVLERAPGRTHLHFACHGLYHWSNVELSGLQLADADLTLERILSSDLDLDAARLVTLSACETGIAEIFRRVEGNVFTAAADEFVGLPMGFLQAKTPTVLSSLWLVDDYTTGLLMERFYEHHVREGRGIAASLRDAQRWVRSLDRVEIVRRVRAELAGETLDPEYADALQMVLDDVETYDGTDSPFCHPYYWGAFTVVGAG